jgi:transcriptional regulator with XRE-family HTH domain
MLADLRRACGLTGEVLGERVGMSQSKISKIEKGRVRPTPDDVQQIARALDAPTDVVQDLVSRASSMRAVPSSRRPPTLQASEGQYTFADLERRASRIRIFEPTTVPGLLQISEYTRRVINNFFELSYGNAESLWAETAAAISLRVQRQETLYDLSKNFTFVLNEPVFSNFDHVLTPAYMLAQVDRIDFASRLPNVTVCILPRGSKPRLPPNGGFTVLDDDLVLVEAGHNAFDLREQEDLDFYRNLFDHYLENSVSDLEPILTRYKAIYAEAARPKD